MLRRFSTNFAVFSIAVDLLVVWISLWGINQLRPYLSNISFAKQIDLPPSLPAGLYVAFPLVWVLSMMLASVYDGRKNFRIVDEFTNLTISSLLASISLAGILYLTYRETSRVTFAFFTLTAYLLLIIWRVFVRIFYRWRNESRGNVSKILIVGAGPVGRDLESRILGNPHLDVQLAGFLDDDEQKRARNPKILGEVAAARKILEEHQVTDVIIALPTRAYEKVNNLVKDLEDQSIKIWIVPDYFSLSLHHTEMENFLGLPMLDLRAAALSEYQRMLKRMFDLAFSLLFLVPALPVMAFVALAIRIVDGRPVLYVQQRVGENGRMFKFYKFRTMIRNADTLQKQVETVNDQGDLIHKRENDPRVTRLGRFLRRLSLDELPQFFNVLRGNMSLVGPRPELPYLVELYQPWQRKRFAVPQGITGWWQIHGRSDKPMHLHTEDDLYYIQNYSIWLDIKIIVQTTWIILRGIGAY
jgi:exopolysaccharide biosynthesis polyprenyl glycosylphosphotransferase